jgi:hypothetical protein
MLTKAWPPMRLGYSNSHEDLVEVVADATIAASRYDTPALSVEIDIVLSHHRPLGCVIEESLASSQPNQHIVFVASVTEGGAAAQAGLLTGDVIIGLSNAFVSPQSCGEANRTAATDLALPVVLTNVTGWAIDRVCVIDIIIPFESKTPFWSHPSPFSMRLADAGNHWCNVERTMPPFNCVFYGAPELWKNTRRP